MGSKEKILFLWRKSCCGLDTMISSSIWLTSIPSLRILAPRFNHFYIFVFFFLKKKIDNFSLAGPF